MARPRLVGVNHVALEVGDVDAAIEFYGRLFDFKLRGRVGGIAFIDLGDQFLALSESRRQPADDDRHFGLVVDDLDAARRALADAGVPIVQGARGVDFRDPWGNRVELVGYPEIQFTKAPGVAAGMGLDQVSKTPAAIEELRDKRLL
jgi:catechol 2,3-dioxygenase-like lactoylglutathione lyase family enzyme